MPPDVGFDLVIADARLRGNAQRWWIGISDGLIAEVSHGPLSGAHLIDAAGKLVTESFVDAHLHLDRVHSADVYGVSAVANYRDGANSGTTYDAIEQAAQTKLQFTEPVVEANARHCLRQAVRYGIRHILAFADVDPVVGLRGIRPLLRLREEFRGVLELHVVALPQDGLVHKRGTEDLIRDAVALGVDVVGGAPWIEPTQADAAEHVRRMCQLAADRELRVAMLVDEGGDRTVLTAEMLAATMIDLDIEGRGIAIHGRTLAYYDPAALLRFVRLAQRAQLGFVVAPHTAAARVPMAELVAAGLPVALGQSHTEDAFYPFGRQNPAEVAFLAAHLLGAMTEDDLEQLFDAITTTAADVIGVAGHQLVVGGSADLLVHDAETVREVLRQHAPPRVVVAAGQVVDVAGM